MINFAAASMQLINREHTDYAEVYMNYYFNFVVPWTLQRYLLLSQIIVNKIVLIYRERMISRKFNLIHRLIYRSVKISKLQN